MRLLLSPWLSCWSLIRRHVEADFTYPLWLKTLALEGILLTWRLCPNTSIFYYLFVFVGAVFVALRSDKPDFATM